MNASRRCLIPSSSTTSRTTESSGVSPVSRKPATSPYQVGGRPRLRTNTMRPARSTIAPTTGTGLRQCTKSHAGHARRSRPPCGCGHEVRATRGQYRKSAFGIARMLAASRGIVTAAERQRGSHVARKASGADGDAGRGERSRAPSIQHSSTSAPSAIGRAVGRSDLRRALRWLSRCAAERREPRAAVRTCSRQMSVARIIRTMDFGAMMSLTYMLDRADREAVASYLGVPGEDRAPWPSARTAPSGTVRVASCSLPAPPVYGTAGARRRATRAIKRQSGFTAAEVPKLALRWAFGFAGDVNAFAPPAVLGEHLFVPSAGGSIYALDAKTGCIHWHFQADGPVRTAMVVAPLDAGAARHAVLFGDQAGRFYALAAETGAPPVARATRAARVHQAHGCAARARGRGLRAGRVVGGKPAAQSGLRAPHVSRQRGRVSHRGRLAALAVVPRHRGAQGHGHATTAGVREWGPSGAGTWSAPTLDSARGLIYVTTGNNYTGMTAHSDAVVALRPRRRRDRVVESSSQGRRVQSLVQPGCRLSRHGLRHRRIRRARELADGNAAPARRPEVRHRVRPRPEPRGRARLAGARGRGRHQRRRLVGPRERRPQRLRGRVRSRPPRARRRRCVRLARQRVDPHARRGPHRPCDRRRRESLVRGARRVLNRPSRVQPRAAGSGYGDAGAAFSGERSTATCARSRRRMAACFGTSTPLASS